MADKYYTSTFLPIKKNLQTKELSWAVPGLLQDAYAAYTAPSRALQGQIDVNSPQGLLEANNFALNIVGGSSLPKLGTKMQPGSLGITAWHGSPAKFNKFDPKFAKTGAGAEAYGPGTYLSESVDLAKGYQPRSDTFENAISKLSERAYDTDKYVAADIYDNFLLHKTPEEIKSSINEMYKGKDLIEAKNALNQATKLYQTKSKGGLYKVDLPDQYLPSFLNWDEPISTQSELIQNIALQNKNQLIKDVKSFQKNPINAELSPKSIYDLSGQSLIKALGGVEEAAKKLPEYGVKGVKYFDTYSPGAGAGASNYVVYDPNILKILERNGLLLP